MSDDPSAPRALMNYPPALQAELQKINQAGQRYVQTGSVAAIDEGIKSIDAILNSPDFPRLHEGLRMQFLDSAPKLYRERFRRNHDIEDLNRALSLSRDTVRLMHPDWPEFPDFLSNLAKEFWLRYEQTRDPHHLEEYAELVGQLPLSHLQAAGHLTTAGIAYATRFNTTGARADLDEALRCFRSAVVARPSDVRLLNNLVMTLWNRYKATNDEEDLDAYRESLKGFPPTSDEFVNHLTVLAKELWNRFEQTNDVNRFDDYERTVRLLPPSVIDWPGLLNDVGTGHMSRYDQTGALEDLNESIRSFELAIHAMAGRQAHLPEKESWFARLLQDVRVRARRPEASASVEASPEDLTGRYLSNLGTAMMTRYGRIGSPDDLDQAIAQLGAAVDSSPSRSPELAARLASLGDALRLRYLRTRIPNDLALAMERFARAVAAVMPGSPDFASVHASRGIGLVDRYEAFGNVDDMTAAVADFRAAVAHMVPGSPDRLTFSNCLGTGLSKLYDATHQGHDLDEAIALFDEVVGVARRKRLAVSELAIYLNNLSSALTLRYESRQLPDDLDTAIDSAREATTLCSPDSPMLPSLFANLGSRLSSRYRQTTWPGDLDAAIEAWERGLRSLHASNVAASVSFTVGSERTWPALYSNLVSVYLTRMRREPDNGSASLRRAIEVAEESKSSLLVQQFSRAEMPAPAGITVDRVERERQLLAQLRSLDAGDLAAYGRAGAAPSVVGDTRSSQIREQARDELERIWTLVEQAGPQAAEYVALRRGDAPLWKRLTELVALDADTALLSLFTARDNTVMFVIKKGSEPRCVEGVIGEAAWNDISSALVKEVHRYNRRSDGRQSWDGPLRPLLEKTCAELGSVHRVILAPHRSGHAVPWSAAISHLGLRGATENPLPVVTTPTLGLLAGLQASVASRERQALVVGNPLGDLTFAEQEAHEVATRFGAQALTRKAATKKAVLDGLAASPVVHLATHAFLAKGSPMDSGIVLADGVLTAREVVQQRVRTDLLVLSACETGLGTFLGGDELAGLGRAFMYAGARSLLVSLWKVDDIATATLMASFYDAYCSGSDKAEALSRAMGTVRADARWQHPYFWGSFVLMGGWN